MIKFSTISKYKGLFSKCHCEICPYGLALFDANNNHVGRITNEGFAIDEAYEYADQLKVELTKRNITYFDVDLHDDIKLEQILSEIQSDAK